MLGRYAEALADLVKAVDIDPKNESAHLNKGLVEERLGRPSDAAASYRAFIALNPVQYQAHVPFAKKRLADIKKR
jgi:Flp pilus assembly protein TadD